MIDVNHIREEEEIDDYYEEEFLRINDSEEDQSSKLEKMRKFITSKVKNYINTSIDLCYCDGERGMCFYEEIDNFEKDKHALLNILYSIGLSLATVKKASKHCRRCSSRCTDYTHIVSKINELERDELLNLESTIKNTLNNHWNVRSCLTNKKKLSLLITGFLGSSYAIAKKGNNSRRLMATIGSLIMFITYSKTVYIHSFDPNNLEINESLENIFQIYKSFNNASYELGCRKTEHNVLSCSLANEILNIVEKEINKKIKT